MSGDPKDLSAWVGRRERSEDVIGPGPVTRLSATLDRDDAPPAPGDALPPGWHWLYFLPTTPESRLAPDGHDTRGGFLPPVELPRRMWAGGRIKFHRPLRIGEAVVRDSEIVSVTAKRGRRGPLVFVVVRHVISGDDGPAVEEEHDIVYREAPRPGEPPPAPVQPARAAAWRRTIHADAVLLFRFSALIFNGHRIHYDRAYATEAEGYPGLIAIAPGGAKRLAATLRPHPPGPALAFPPSFR